MDSLVVLPAWLVTWALLATFKVKVRAIATPTSAAVANPASATMVPTATFGPRLPIALITSFMSLLQFGSRMDGRHWLPRPSRAGSRSESKGRIRSPSRHLKRSLQSTPIGGGSDAEPSAPTGDGWNCLTRDASAGCHGCTCRRRHPSAAVHRSRLSDDPDDRTAVPVERGRVSDRGSGPDPAARAVAERSEGSRSDRLAGARRGSDRGWGTRRPLHQ